jgi:hypothetical protein
MALVDFNLAIGYPRPLVPDPNPTIQSVSVSLPDANLTIKSYRHQVPTVTEYPRLTSSSRQFFYFSIATIIIIFICFFIVRSFGAFDARPTIKLDGDFKNTNNQRLKKNVCG